MVEFREILCEIKEKQETETKKEIEFYIYEDVERQDLQVECKNRKVELSYLSFEKLLDKIYNEAHN